MSFRCALVMTICVFVDNTGLTSKFPEFPRLGFYWSCGTTWSIVLSRTRPKSLGKHRCWILMSPAINRLHTLGFPTNDAILDGLSWCKWARSCILTSHVIKRLHIWQVKLRISDRWCHSQSMQRAFPVRAMVITSSEICMNFAVKIVFLLCFGALVWSDYWQVWTTLPKPQWTRLWRSDVELFEHCDRNLLDLPVPSPHRLHAQPTQPVRVICGQHYSHQEGFKRVMEVCGRVYLV